jgi:glycosyltransferase involved in cell wall biosynthesis
MEILYVSRLCSESRLAALLRDLPVKPPQQEQKFHGLLARALTTLTGGVTALSVLPPRPAQGWRPATERESEAGVEYRYMLPGRIPLLSHALVFAWSFAASLRWIRARRGQSPVLVCDVLDLSITAGARLAAKACRIPAIAIVTDVPEFLHGYIGTGKTLLARLSVWAYRNLSTIFMTRYDGFIVLTEGMDPLVNPRGRPSLVLEGLADPGMGRVPNDLESKHPQPVVLYAGALYRKYGVGTLLDAFLKVPNPGARLWLFGSGELEAVLGDYLARDPRITYWGVRPNAEVVDAEVRALLLVNPRPSQEPFTRFSFPSKNMEYMASGTAVLTTPLPGMPAEYAEHVYFFEDESVEGMAATLGRLLARPREELHRRGQGAKAFVLTRKSSLVQAERVRAFLEALPAATTA